jgi:hypothetical protein
MLTNVQAHLEARAGKPEVVARFFTHEDVRSAV